MRLNALIIPAFVALSHAVAAPASAQAAVYKYSLTGSTPAFSTFYSMQWDCRPLIAEVIEIADRTRPTAAPHVFVTCGTDPFTSPPAVGATWTTGHYDTSTGTDRIFTLTVSEVTVLGSLPLSADGGLAIAGAILLVWAIGYVVRVALRIGTNSQD